VIREERHTTWFLAVSHLVFVAVSLWQTHTPSLFRLAYMAVGLHLVGFAAAAFALIRRRGYWMAQAVGFGVHVGRSVLILLYLATPAATAWAGTWTHLALALLLLQGARISIVNETARSVRAVVAAAQAAAAAAILAAIEDTGNDGEGEAEDDR
jgi:hypothetical protein